MTVGDSRVQPRIVEAPVDVNETLATQQPCSALKQTDVAELVRLEIWNCRTRAFVAESKRPPGGTASLLKVFDAYARRKVGSLRR